MKLFDIIQVKSGLLADNASKAICLENGGFATLKELYTRVCITLGNAGILELFSHFLVFSSYLEKANEKKNFLQVLKGQ